MTPHRTGLLAAGNFIVDHVKMIDAWPQQDMLATVLSATRSNGGGPYNVLKNLAALGVSYPLQACGLVGDDDDGRWIRSDLAALGIDTRRLQTTDQQPTSSTDAMTVASTGRRTFFHQRGANAHFQESHCGFVGCHARLFHLGYLMLLDSLDELDESGGTGAARLLEQASRAGLITSVDMVSTEHPRFRQIALATLPWTDHLIINEIEASRVLERSLRADDRADLQAAAEQLLSEGVRVSVTLHTERGAITQKSCGTSCWQPSLKLPDGFIRGATGAGDAFAAGLLHGLHEDWPTEECLRLAVCVAAASLTDPTASGGVQPMKDCLALLEKHGPQPLSAE